mgnify:CR=1 FL=1
MLRVEKLCSEGVFKDVSFSLRKGEILGISGMMGAGRSEIMRAIFGIDPHTSGKIYLEGNLDYVRTFLKENLPEIKLTEPEGTYLLWLDFKSLGMKEEQLKDLVENKAKLWLDSGAMFGPDGEGFERINIACPREILKQALTQLAESVHDR